MLFAVRLERAVDRSDEKRGMRPGRLREVFDDAGDPVVALDQQHIAGLHDAPQMVRVARCERLVTGDFLLQVPRDPFTDGIEHYAHGFPPAVLRPLLFT
ncbi:hypothetical protein ACVWW1_006422 [Bradyrhizobium sp. JR3.5]